jgi:hypothetical protein
LNHPVLLTDGFSWAAMTVDVKSPVRTSCAGQSDARNDVTTEKRDAIAVAINNTAELFCRVDEKVIVMTVVNPDSVCAGLRLHLSRLPRQPRQVS